MNPHRSRHTQHTIFLGVILLVALPAAADYPVVDSGQNTCYDNTQILPAPSQSEDFFGQDAQYEGNQPGFFISADGLTADDAHSGLTWQRSCDTDLDGDLEPDDKLSWWDALAQPDILNEAQFGGFNDWRLPNIKELYSLIDFRGVDPSGYEGGDTSWLTPFLDTTVFDFIYGDESVGERIIDSQYWTTSEYVSTTMNGDHTVFGVNFADGRIKGYPTVMMGSDKTAFVLCVRGNPDYSLNDLVDNANGTVTDRSTGLMWQQDDSQEGKNWQGALSYAETLVFANHDDWRLPNAKELQSLVDYTRSPSTHGTAAIDPIFSSSTIIDEDGETNFPSYWTGTTHANWTQNPGSQAIYVAFGEAQGWMQSPFPPYDYTLLDVHGAGAQRSDPKVGDPADWPYGHGPQGDVIRIFNHVRCVRDAEVSTGIGDLPEIKTGMDLHNHPNPFNPATSIVFSVPRNSWVTVDIFDSAGRQVTTLLSETVTAGKHEVNWNGNHQSGRPAASGLYFARLKGPDGTAVAKMVLAK